MGLLPKAPRCSLCKREVLTVKVRTPGKRVVSASWCRSCDTSPRPKGKP